VIVILPFNEGGGTMDKSKDTWWRGDDFRRGVASGVVSSLITAYVLFIAGASIAVAAKGPAGSKVNFGGGLSTLLAGVITPSILIFILWFGHKQLNFAKSFDGRMERLKYPYLIYIFGFLSLWAASTFLFAWSLAVIWTRIQK
jgi:hypothetical protein